MATFNLEIPDDLLFRVLDKEPKEPWDRYVEAMNEKHGTSYTVGYVKIARAIAENEFDCVGRGCERLSREQWDAIRAGLRLNKSHREIAQFADVSPSSVSRISRLGVNLEYSQIYGSH